ncbi:MAG TPA: sigma factor-like helix-turn-helix DNA-binding protein [Solirubrobacterales bacterium]
MPSLIRLPPPPTRSPRSLPFPGLDAFGEGELVDLDDRTAHILRMRTGMIDGKPHSLREVGEELGIKQERVRQLQNQGLLLIRQVREVQRHLRREPAIQAFYRWRTP